jgi:hypothetical protein
MKNYDAKSPYEGVAIGRLHWNRNTLIMRTATIGYTPWLLAALRIWDTEGSR